MGSAVMRTIEQTMSYMVPIILEDNALYDDDISPETHKRIESLFHTLSAEDQAFLNTLSETDLDNVMLEKWRPGPNGVCLYLFNSGWNELPPGVEGLLDQIFDMILEREE